jgi:hypothetical protein
LAIALFYSVGTAVGGITGPALFGQFIHSGQSSLVAIGFFVGAAAMILGGIAELRWGVPAERQPLEYVATPLTAEAADRIEVRGARRNQRERQGVRRFRPGPTNSFYSPAMVGTAGSDRHSAAASATSLDQEIQVIGQDLAVYGPTDRRVLAVRLRARTWGPGRFGPALREAEREGRVRRISRTTYGPGSPGR